MILHYKLKKKAGKKMVSKLEKIKPHILGKILDDYFFKVCCNFYKRQMQIWILLRHKYLRTSAVGINISERRFNNLNLLRRESTLSPEIEANAIKANYPIYFSEAESEPIKELTSEIGEVLTALFRNTNETAPVGNLGEYLTAQGSTINEEKKNLENVDLAFEDNKEDEEKKKEPKLKINHYKAMGLTKTSLVKKIAQTVGVTIKGKKSGITSLKGSKTSKAKSGAKKKG